MLLPTAVPAHVARVLVEEGIIAGILVEQAIRSTFTPTPLKGTYRPSHSNLPPRPKAIPSIY
jgi:hypothetical protein